METEYKLKQLVKEIKKIPTGYFAIVCDTCNQSHIAINDFITLLQGTDLEGEYCELRGVYELATGGKVYKAWKPIHLEGRYIDGGVMFPQKPGPKLDKTMSECLSDRLLLTS